MTGERVLVLEAADLGDLGQEEPVTMPSKLAIFQARARLGAEPLRALFSRVAAPLAEPGVASAWVAGRRLVAIDGTCLDVAERNLGHPTDGSSVAR